MDFDPKTRMIIMRGISGSGKSTCAQKIAEHDPVNTVIVSRDAIRAEIMGKDKLEQYFQQGLNLGVEQIVTNREHYAIAQALTLGKKVVIDNTNLRPKYIMTYFKLAKDFDINPLDVVIYQCEIDSIEAAYNRVQQRGERLVSKQVLQSQFDTLRSFPTGREFNAQERKALDEYVPRKWHLVPFEVEPYTPNPEYPKAIVCDLDGTLAHRSLITEPFIHYRSFYEYEKCDTDEVDLLVSDVIHALHDAGYQIVFVSGRKNTCRKETVEFIERAVGLKRQDYTLLMRNPMIDSHYENGRVMDDPDHNVKYRLFNESLRKNSNIVGVIDDRKRVVALWEALGIRVLNVGLLNEEF